MVDYERLFGSRRSYITRSDDDYVGDAAGGFDQAKVNVAIIAPRLSFFAFYRRFLLL